MGNWETFDSDRFVGRNDLILEIENHISQNRKRVISVVGGPGTGKSWLLAQCKKKWDEQNRRFIFSLHCSDLVPNNGRAVDDQCLKTWLKTVLAQAQAIDSNFPHLNLDNNTQFVIQEFVRILCDEFIRDGAAPVLLVDDYDELHREAILSLNRLVLEFFLSRQQFAIVLARRDQNGLSSDALRRNEVVVEIKKSDQNPTNQVDALTIFRSIQRKFYEGIENQEDAFKQCMEGLRDYNWIHPFINTFLSYRFLSRAYQGDHNGCWAKEDIKKCIEELVSRPRVDYPSVSPPGHPPAPPYNRYPPLTNNEFQLLWRIANELPPTWTERELILCVEKRLRDLQNLFELGIIVPSPNYKFQIMNGLHGLFKAY